MHAESLAETVRNRTNLAAELFAELERGTHDGVGITRASYGEGEQFARDLMARKAAELGLEVADDHAGNVYMTLPGRDRAAPKVVIGSHLDSVAQGGNYDGAAGVVSGLTAVAGLIDAGIVPPRDISVMGIRAEESAWFGTSYIGSRSALGTLPADALDTARRTDTGRTLADHMAALGYDPEGVRKDKPYLPRAGLHAYMEVHIEQGPVLDEKGVAVGVVSGIRGNLRLPKARCVGEYSHCGGVPHSHRRDAVVATSELVMRLEQLWDEVDASGGDFAFTVGKFGTDPEWHAMTKIAGQVDFSIDMRSLYPDYWRGLESQVTSIMAEIEKRRGVRFERGPFTRAEPGILDEGIKARLREGAGALDLSWMDIPSGASHDAAAFAAAGVPTAMIFVRNANGSHNPDEAMALDDFMSSTKLLAWWLARGI